MTTTYPDEPPRPAAASQPSGKGKAKGQSAQAWLQAHKKPLAIGGAALVAVIAYEKYSSGGSSSSGDSTTDGTGTTGEQVGYDSGGLDTYGTLSGAISALNDDFDREEAMIKRIKARQAALRKEIAAMRKRRAKKPATKKKPAPGLSRLKQTKSGSTATRTKTARKPGPVKAKK